MNAPRPAGLGPKARLDLHIHTHRSDGRLGPVELVQAAASRGLDVLAITDHDLPPALPAGPHRVGHKTLHLVHAAEVSARHHDREIHVLVYFAGEMPAEFQELLRGRARWRAHRYDEALSSMGLADRVAPASAEARAGEQALTRHHLAQALVEAGVESNVKGAFAHHLSHRHGHVRPTDLPVANLLDQVRGCGGFSSWAHPPHDVVRDWTPELSALGLDAIEVSRPGLGRHARAVYARIALDNRVATTGGSDWHGWHGGAPGQFSVPLRAHRPAVRAMGLVEA